ncbi:MAG: DotU family type IV/VI secretion system protein [Colwellia sp.]|nr:DotU family type IV/VI secretion system protein [Colwellia sp.]
MSAALPNTTTIDFGDNIMGNQAPFDYSDNQLYNLSIPLLSILLTLERLPKPDNLSVFKSLLKQHIVDLSEQGKKLDYPSAVIDKLCCLHCIVLDEFIIHSRWGISAGWENNTLLSELFNLQSGGDLFFTITEKAMRQSGKMIDLLAVIYICLQMGFKGRYRSRQSEKIGIIIKEIRTVTIDNKILPKVIMQETPVNKGLFLTSRRYFSFALIMMLLLVFVVTFFDYWFKETYPARSREVRELNKIITSYNQNEASSRLFSLTDSTAEPSTTNDNITVTDNHQQTELDKSGQISALYRVQLNSFSARSNAENFLSKIDNNLYDLSIKPIGKYYIVYSLANSELAAEQQQHYYQTTYQLSAIIFQLNNMSKRVL